MDACLREANLFHGLQPEDVDALLGAMERGAYRAGELIVGPDGVTGRLYLVIEGAVRVFERGPDGREFTIDVLAHGSLFGLAGLLEHNHPSHLVDAVSDCVIGAGPARDMLAVMTGRPSIARNLLAQLSARLARHEQRLAVTASADARTRLAVALHRMAADAGEPLSQGARRLPTGLTQTTLARQIGSRRETVCRLLASFDQEGLTRRDGDGALVVHLPRLTEAFELAESV